MRLAAGLARAVAVELLVGRAILARANQIALPALSDRVPAELERLRFGPGCIDGRPTDMTNIIVLLHRGNLLRGVECVVLTDARSDICDVRLKLQGMTALGLIWLDCSVLSLQLCMARIASPSLQNRVRGAIAAF